MTEPSPELDQLREEFAEVPNVSIARDVPTAPHGLDGRIRTRAPFSPDGLMTHVSCVGGAAAFNRAAASRPATGGRASLSAGRPQLRSIVTSLSCVN
jgi:hypothetical protein